MAGLTADQILEDLFTSISGVEAKNRKENSASERGNLNSSAASVDSGLDITRCLVKEFQAFLVKQKKGTSDIEREKGSRKHKEKKRKKEKKKFKEKDDKSPSQRKNKKKKREKEKEKPPSDLEDGEIVDSGVPRSSSRGRDSCSRSRHHKHDEHTHNDGHKRSYDAAFARDKEEEKLSSKRLHDHHRHSDRHSLSYRDHYRDHHRSNYSSSNSYSHRHSSRDHQRHRRSSSRNRLPDSRDRRHRSSSGNRTGRRSVSPDSRQRSRLDHDRIDKAKLHEAARRNLQRMKANGTLPAGLVDANIEALKQPEVQQKSLAELTEYCHSMCDKTSASGQGQHDSELSDGGENADASFRKQPHVLKTRPESITMNIRNAVALPVRKASELKTQLKEQFPVSTGSRHKTNELEWVPVKPTPVSAPVIPAVTVGDEGHRMIRNKLNFPAKAQSKQKETGVVAPTMRTTEAAPEETAIVDIGTIVAKRLEALRRITENPLDYEAQMELQETELKAKDWVKASKRQSQDYGGLVQLDWTGEPQAWARKDQLKDAEPLKGGIGLKLLQKMGWQPGEGLGRNNEGTLEPLALDIKMDKKGLVSREEVSKPLVQKLAVDFSGRHPVSALNEICLKRRWGAPVFEQVMEAGPDHLKSFLFKVIVNKVEYRPAVASPNKKEARVQAAAVCLQAMGMLPKLES